MSAVSLTSTPDPFEPNPENTRKIERLLEFFVEQGPGSFIEWEPIERIAEGSRYGEGRWVIKAARDRLLKDFSIATRCNYDHEPPLGVRLLTGAEQLRCGVDRSWRAIRQIRRGRAEVQAVDTTNMSDHARRYKLIVLEGLQAEEQRLRAQVKQNKRKPSEVTPIRPTI